MKKCSRCQEVKPLTDFSKVRHGRVGALCKDCAAEKQREYYNEVKFDLHVKRSVQRLNTTIANLQKRASNYGYKVCIRENDNNYTVTMEKL